MSTDDPDRLSDPFSAPGSAGYRTPPPAAAPAPTEYGEVVGYGQPPSPSPQGGARPGYGQVGDGPPGQIRGTGVSMLLYVVTLTIYGFFYFYKVHDEMKRHSGRGLGGGIALLLYFFVGIAMPFIMASEVGALYDRKRAKPPVSGVTGLWILLPFVGGIIWFVKVNGALNRYWEGQGVTA